MNLSTFSFFAQDGDAAGVVGLIFFVLYMAVIVLIIASMWKLFAKAGKPGWASIIPIYNSIVMLEIVGRPIWWIVLLIIPCTAPFVAIIVMIDLAKSFGKDTLFGVGLVLLGFIFLPMLAFGSAEYQGPSAEEA